MRIAFAWELGGGLGHLARLAPWVAAFAAGGATPLLAARDLAAVARSPWFADIEVMQAPFLPHGPHGAPADPVSYAGILLNAGYGDARTLAALVNAWRALLRYSGARALVADFSPTAMLAARMEGLPLMHVGDGFTIPPAGRAGGSFDLLGQAGVADLERTQARVMDSVRHAAGSDLAAGAGIEALLAADETLLATYAELDHHRPCERATPYSGHVEPAAPADAGWRDVPGPRILAYLKPTERHFEALVAHLEAMPVQTRIYASGLVRADTSASGRGLVWSANPMPFAAAAAAADLVVCHAGHGAVCTALIAGKPLFMLPAVYEQLLTARNVEAMGAGAWNHPVHDAARIHRKLARCLEDDTMRAAAAAFARRHAGSAAESTVRLSKTADRMLALARSRGGA